MKPELMKRMVKGPDGVEFEVEPLRDYYCEAPPTVMPAAYSKIVEDLFNWARAESLWILGFGTGCGAIEMRPPFDVVLAPQEIPIGPPTEYHSSYLALMHTNRAIFPIAKIVIYMNLFFGGADNWASFFLKVFLIYLWSAFVGVCFPRFRVEQSIRWFLIWPVPIGLLSILVV